MRKLETFKRNLVIQKQQREMAAQRRELESRRRTYAPVVQVPPEYIQRYYVAAFQAFYHERLEGCATFSRAQVEAMVDQHLYESRQEFLANRMAFINSDTKWIPVLIRDDGNYYQIKLGDVPIVSFNY